MKKTVGLVCLLCAVPVVANAWFWNSGKDKAAVVKEENDSSDYSNVRRKRMKSAADNSAVDNSAEMSAVKKEKTDREKLIEGLYGVAKGSPNLIRLESDSSNRGGNNFDVMMKNREKITNDTVSDMKDRSEKYKQQYEAQRGIPLDEMEAYYSSNVGVKQDKKLEQVYDPLDKH